MLSCGAGSTLPFTACDALAPLTLAAFGFLANGAGHLYLIHSAVVALVTLSGVGVAAVVVVTLAGVTAAAAVGHAVRSGWFRGSGVTSRGGARGMIPVANGRGRGVSKIRELCGMAVYSAAKCVGTAANAAVAGAGSGVADNLVVNRGAVVA